MEFTLTIIEIVSLFLGLIFLFLLFKLAETNWSYRINKPYAWEEAVKSGRVSGKLKRMERFYRDKVRFYSIWIQIERLRHDQVPGAFAELGVYKGETARFIHEMDPSRDFHLFDTFSGFDPHDIAHENKAGQHLQVDFTDTSEESVVKYMEGNNRVIIHKGWFPESASSLSTEHYAFVHLDADLFDPTREGLRYFYPRLTPGGVIIIHDYNHNWEGVTKAVNDFCQTIPEKPVAISDWQGSVMIVKNAGR